MNRRCPFKTTLYLKVNAKSARKFSLTGKCKQVVGMVDNTTPSPTEFMWAVICTCIGKLLIACEVKHRYIRHISISYMYKVYVFESFLFSSIHLTLFKDHDTALRQITHIQVNTNEKYRGVSKVKSREMIRQVR